MKVINATNVNDALYQGIDLIKYHGVTVESRNGTVLEYPEPVATVYERPWERVLINETRDANPFFHLMESIWILQGRNDVKFLNEFNKRMVDYSDNGVTFNAPYGYRLRNYFDSEFQLKVDQLEAIVEILRDDPNSRQAVCQIWDTKDIFKHTKDKACNMQIVFSIRDMQLNMTVYNRSNDMVWGAYGANMVQFSMIQEYIAAHLDVLMGTYTQVSNSYHVYTTGAGGKVWDRLAEKYPDYNNPYVHGVTKNFVRMQHNEMDDFEFDINMFFNRYDDCGLVCINNENDWGSNYFKDLIIPVLDTYVMYKEFGIDRAIAKASEIKADDWKIACKQWLENRRK